METRKIVPSNELYHYGVKGMKWRHKKGVNSYEYIKEKKRHEDEQEAIQLENHNENLYQQYKTRELKAKKRKKVTDRKKTDRTHEKDNARLATMHPKAVKAGESYVNKMIGKNAEHTYQDRSTKRKSK